MFLNQICEFQFMMKLIGVVNSIQWVLLDVVCSVGCILGCYWDFSIIVFDISMGLMLFVSKQRSTRICREKNKKDAQGTTIRSVKFFISPTLSLWRIKTKGELKLD